MITTIIALLGGWRATALAVALMLASSIVATQTYRLRGAQTALATAVTAKATLETAIAKAAQDAEAKARAIEQSQAEAIAKAEDAYQRGKTDAQTTADRVAADLRNGTVRLRRELAGCQTGSVPAASPGIGGLDAAADVRNTIAGAAVGVGTACDARVTALQAILRAEREAVP